MIGTADAIFASKPDQRLSPREKYLRSCQFYVVYLFSMIFKNLGEQYHDRFVFPKNALRLPKQAP